MEYGSTKYLAMFSFNSLAPGGFDYSLKLVNFKLISTINILSIFCEIAIRWMPQYLTDHQSILVQVMAWCRQATSHYLSQCWPRSMSPYGVTRPQWVKAARIINFRFLKGDICKPIVKQEPAGEGFSLTHWGRVTHICVSDLTSIGSDNGMLPGRRQAIIRTNAGILLIRPLGTNFSEFLVEILIFSFKKMRLKASSAKRRPCCLGLNVLTHLVSVIDKAGPFITWMMMLMHFFLNIFLIFLICFLNIIMNIIHRKLCCQASKYGDGW